MSDTSLSRFGVVLGKVDDVVSSDPVDGKVLEIGQIHTVPPTA